MQSYSRPGTGKDGGQYLEAPAAGVQMEVQEAREIC